MRMTAATRLGPYEILSPIGAGGMGEVWRARDSRIARDVAIKLLPQSFSASEDRLRRFEQEARAAGALNHPGLVTIFDVGIAEGSPYIVMELLEGATLREVLGDDSPSALPLRKAVDYATQLASALAVAHEKGIIHRDLKPENLFVTTDGRVKILDFGLAKLNAPDRPDDSSTQQKQTSPGTVMGTAGYMSPEQVRGQAVDHRTDIFSLGAILYEMLSGRRAFRRDSSVETMNAVLKEDPPELTVIDPKLPPAVERVVRHCLEKNPRERFQSARDLAFALDAAPAAGMASAAGAPVRSKLAALAAVVLIAIAASALLLRGRRAATTPSAPPPVARFGILATVTWSDSATISPDGRHVVYSSGAEWRASAPSGTGADPPGGRSTDPVASSSGRFWLRRLDTLEPRALSDTEAAVPLFFWSPDSRFLGYRSGNILLLREVNGGPPRVMTDLPAAAQGVAWSRAGDIIVALPGGLYRMNSSGGSPKLLLRSEPDREVWRGSPSFLADGKRFLFTVLKSGVGEQALETRVASLDGSELGTVTTGVTGAMYVDGHLLFGAGGALYAQPFDDERLALTGERVELARSVAQDWRTGRLAVGVSHTGVLVYRASPRSDARFVVVDRSGRHLRHIGLPDSFTNFSVSPAEDRVITARRDPVSGHLSLWMIDTTRGVTSLVTETTDTDDADDPTWLPDGKNIAYRHGARLVVRPANGGAERTVVAAEAYPDAFSHDGRFLIYGQPRGNVFEQWAIDITAPGAKPIPLVTGVTLADEGRISPNGRWVATHSNETGTAQISVIPFPPTGERWQVSRDGGVQPRWSADGNELFYLDPDGRMMVVRMPASEPRRAAAPEALFATGIVPSDALDQFAPLRDGFVLRVPVRSAAEASAVQVIVNWPALIRH